MNRPSFPRFFGFAISEVIVFLAIIAFLGAIIIPGTVHKRGHHSTQTTGAEVSTTNGDQWAMRDENADDGVVFIKASPR